MTKNFLTKLTVGFLLMGLLTACGQAPTPTPPADSDEMGVEDPVGQQPPEAGEQPQEDQAQPPADAENDDEETGTGDASEPEIPPVDLKAMKVNELGQIMILMYHDIGSKEDVWVRTPENFRKDLQTLYDKGYRAVSMKDYLDNNISVPAGTTPVVIVFDDGTQGQFNVLEDQGDFVIDPNCAVGILEDFYKAHPDFGLEATFYIYYPIPFRQQDLIEKKLQYIVEKGMDIGNHSYTHDNLRKDMDTKKLRDADYIQASLGKNAQKTQQIVPGYVVDSLALPYGASPEGDLYQYVVKGKYEDTEYHNRAVLLVGANPAKPLYHISTDPSRIPRVRASETDTAGLGLYDWLSNFDKHPERRFISDGDPSTISFPKGMEDQLNPELVQNKKIQAYE